MLAFASEHRAYFNTLDRRVVDDACNGFGNFFASRNNQFARCGMDDVVYRNTAEDAFVERRYNLVAVFKGGTNQSAQRSAVFLVDNHVVRHVNQTACEVSCIGRFHGRVGKTLTGTVRRNEVF